MIYAGNLVFFHGLGNYILVLNSLEAIQDLLDKRGPNYSHRPVFTVVGELMGLGQVSHNEGVSTIFTLFS